MFLFIFVLFNAIIFTPITITSESNSILKSKHFVNLFFRDQEKYNKDHQNNFYGSQGTFYYGEKKDYENNKFVTITLMIDREQLKKSIQNNINQPYFPLFDITYDLLVMLALNQNISDEIKLDFWEAFFPKKNENSKQDQKKVFDLTKQIDEHTRCRLSNLKKDNALCCVTLMPKATFDTLKEEYNNSKKNN